MYNHQPCIKNSECRSGYCEGVCKSPKLFQPCNPSIETINSIYACLGGHYCHEETAHCIFAGHVPNQSNCHGDYDCPRGTYCDSKSWARHCREKRYLGQNCSSEEECQDGFSCYKESCRLRCNNADQCPHKQECLRPLSDMLFKICWSEHSNVFPSASRSPWEAEGGSVMGAKPYNGSPQNSPYLRDGTKNEQTSSSSNNNTKKILIISGSVALFIAIIVATIMIVKIRGKGKSKAQVLKDPLSTITNVPMSPPADAPPTYDSIIMADFKVEK